jgi:hypothetical protein
MISTVLKSYTMTRKILCFSMNSPNSVH